MEYVHYLHQWKLLTLDGKESGVTIRSILSHTSGIVDGEDSFYGLRRNDPVISLMDILEGRTAYNKRRTMIEKQPGTEFEYSDAGYCVLQLMIHEIMQCSFEEVVGKCVFEPLNLKKTFFASLENLELWEKSQNMAAGYDQADWRLFMGGISVVMTNQNPGVDQTESGLELLAKII